MHKLHPNFSSLTVFYFSVHLTSIWQSLFMSHLFVGDSSVMFFCHGLQERFKPKEKHWRKQHCISEPSVDMKSSTHNDLHISMLRLQIENSRFVHDITQHGSLLKGDEQKV